MPGENPRTTPSPPQKLLYVKKHKLSKIALKYSMFRTLKIIRKMIFYASNDGLLMS